MILEKHNLKEGFRVELVNGDDIVQSYKNKKYVSSCMGNRGRWRYTKLYKYIKDLTLLRIMKDDDLHLRTLIWSVFDEEKNEFKLLDRVYNNYSYCECTGWACTCNKNTHPFVTQIFPSLWPKYADVRNTAKTVMAKILPNKVKIWPSIDTLYYLNERQQLLCNRQLTGFSYIADCGKKVATTVIPV